jgi:hypothetical protein
VKSRQIEKGTLKHTPYYPISFIFTYTGYTPIHYAAEIGFEEIIKILYTAKADLNVEGSISLD